MKSTLTPKAHKQKFNVAHSQQKGLQKPNPFNKVPETPKMIQAKERLKEIQQKKAEK